MESNGNSFSRLEKLAELFRRCFSENGLTEVANIKALDSDSRIFYYQVSSVIEALILENWDQKLNIWCDGIIDFAFVFKAGELAEISGKFFYGKVGHEAKGQTLSGFRINLRDQTVELDKKKYREGVLPFIMITEK